MMPEAFERTAMVWEPTCELRYCRGRITGELFLQQRWRRLTSDNIDVNGVVPPLNGYETEWRDIPEEI